MLSQVPILGAIKIIVPIITLNRKQQMFEIEVKMPTAKMQKGELAGYLKI